MNSNNDFEVFAALDLTPIKVKLMHKESGEGWSRERANATEIEYRRFLYLMKAFPNEETAPSVDVDTFWHYHILDTMKYASDCNQAFGYFLHHYPYIGLRGEDDIAVQEQAGQRMRALYESTFGEPYMKQADAAWCGRAPRDVVSAGQAAWCGRAPVTAIAAAVRTAWCGRAPEAAQETAWCGRAPAEAGANKTAWCGRAPEVAKDTAWCGRAPVNAAAEVQSAWCGRAPANAVAEAQTAWCGRAPLAA